MIHLSVAQEFSRAPGGRFRSVGPDSAKEFFEELLEPRFKEALAVGGKLRGLLEHPNKRKRPPKRA